MQILQKLGPGVQYPLNISIGAQTSLIHALAHGKRVLLTNNHYVSYALMSLIGFMYLLGLYIKFDSYVGVQPFGQSYLLLSSNGVQGRL